MRLWVSKSACCGLLVALAVGAAGCAGFSEPLPEVQTRKSLPAASIPGRSSHERVQPLNPGQEIASVVTFAAGERDGAPDAILFSLAPEQLLAQVQEPSEQEGLEEGEFYDPFEKEEERELEEYDPWEPYNVVVFEFNYQFDRFVVKPAAQAYDFVMPTIVQRGFQNAFHNIKVVPRLFNNLFQGKFKGAGLEVGRFLINSTIGIGGLFDPASSEFGLETPDEDFGQTLGVYGVGPGPYLILPFFPPFTLRDAVGFATDIFLNPYHYFVFENVELGQPALVEHDDTATIGAFATQVGEIVNDRSVNLERFEGVEETTVDLYSAVRNAYLQKRANAIRE